MAFLAKKMTRLARFFVLLLAVLMLWVEPCKCKGWEWEDYLGSKDDIATAFQTDTRTLSMDEVRGMRVRDIKRRLARTHGYSADELGRMLDKKELIQALSFEEHKHREKELEQVKRYVIVRGIVFALLAVVFVVGWPLWVRIYEVAHVNFVVFIDKKRHEASRCMELRSIQGMLGVLLMGIVDTLQVWLTVSVLLSWFLSSPYLFPTPNLSVRPAQFMGETASKGPLGKYGLNVGPMALTWGFRFLQGQLEKLTGRALSRAYQKQKKEAREWESQEERAARKAARKTAKRAARELAENQKHGAEMEEIKRRKEAADKATDALFSSPLQTKTKQQQEDEEKIVAAVFPHRMKTEGSEQRGELDREFKQEMEAVDMDDLD